MSRFPFPSCSRLLLAAGLAVSACGCGGSDRLPTYPASGKVVYTDGSPVPGGAVEFQLVEPSPKSPSARGQIQPDGTFKLTTYDNFDGALKGEHRVIVVPPAVLTRIGEPEPPETVLRKYRQFDTSGLKYTVGEQPEQNQFEVKLEKPKGS